MKTYKTLNQIFEDAKPHQVTAQELLNGRTRLHDEWQEFKLSDELKDSVCVRLAEIFGGRHRTQDIVYHRLKNTNPKHWGLSRTVIENYGVAKLHYIAGQDMPYELAQIRKDLK
jgi:hypothetical protein